MSFILTQLTLKDMNQAAVVHREAFDQRLPWLAGRHTPESDLTYFREHVYAQCEIWGAMDGKIVGIVAFRQGWIDQLYVLPQYQGRGAGNALLCTAQKSFPSLQLWTFQKNVLARRFYEMRGFVAIKETDGQDNDEREPDVLYHWQRAG